MTQNGARKSQGHILAVALVLFVVFGLVWLLSLIFTMPFCLRSSRTCDRLLAEAFEFTMLVFTPIWVVIWLWFPYQMRGKTIFTAGQARLWVVAGLLAGAVFLMYMLQRPVSNFAESHGWMIRSWGWLALARDAFGTLGSFVTIGLPLIALMVALSKRATLNAIPPSKRAAAKCDSPPNPKR